MTRVVLLFALLAVVAWAFWRFVDGVIDTFGGLPNREAKARQRGAPAVKLARDPVCGTWIDPGASLTVNAAGSTHYFCSAKCRDEFRRTA